jgi:acetyltransferase-like isoleucine patch superfamily enzyme
MFLRITHKLENALAYLYLLYKSVFRDIEFGSGIQLIGTPLIDVRKGASLSIGENVRLTSRNFGYHLNLFAPTKLFVDCENATIRIGDDTRIHGSCIHAVHNVSVGSKVLIAANCQIMDSNGHDTSFERVANRVNTKGQGRAIVIEDCVWLATGVVVLPGVRIGRGSVITANSVVVDDVPAMVVAGGNPARTIKEHTCRNLPCSAEGLFKA